MTAAPKSSLWISPEDYLEGELHSEVRHEYIDGAVYAMAGGSDDHNRIAGNIFAHLAQHLRGRRCEAFMTDLKLKASADSAIYYYPDVMVVCDPADRAKFFRERPSIIFEILSPDTERTDRNEKLLAYRAIPSLKMYVLVEQDRFLAVVHRRTTKTWKMDALEGPDAVLRLPPIKLELPFGRIYERTALARRLASSRRDQN